MQTIRPPDLPAVSPQRSLLDRAWRLDGSAREVVLYGLLLLFSIGLHLWQLGEKAMHHDESIHAWMSYKFFTGSGGFTCWGGRQSPTYCYDPVYHGPTLYLLTLLSYLLFGVGDAQARLPQALAGIALVPLAWTLRPWIGRKGALLAAGLLTISPSILYYTRSARHDAFMLVWALLMVIGLFRFLRFGRAFDLALAAAGLALAWATHELVFILIFIGATFFGLRLVWEWQPRVFRVVVLATLAFGLVFAAAYVGISRESWPAVYRWTHRFFGPVLMLVIGALLAAGMTRSWERPPIVLWRLVTTWREQRGAYGIALATFLALFALCFTTFFAYPRGFLDGWYAGITYWLGSQHEFARGGQPWFYYLMLLPLYEPLALSLSLVGLAWLLRGRVPWRDPPLPPEANGHEASDAADGAVAEDTWLSGAWPQGNGLLICFLAYWFVLAFVGFSWAGEKMPWLLIHIALPATLLASWVLGVLIERVPWRQLRVGFGWAAPVLTLVLLLALANAMLAFAGGDATIGGLQARLRGLVPLLVAGLCVFALLSLANRWGGRLVVRLAGLTLAAVLLLYGVRAMTLVVYRHPDVPVEPLIYTQTAPDVPILVRRIEELALNRTRNSRSAEDPTGGHSMPVALDGGSASAGGEGSLAWPMQWYLRDYLNVQWIDVTAQAAIPQDAVVVVLYKPHVTPEVQAQLEEDYVQIAEGVFNWWFPEYTGDPDPNRPGQPPARGYKSLALEGETAWQRVWNVISWPLRPGNWPTLWNYLLYRDLPMELKGREMVVFVRRDALPTTSVAPATPTETLAPEVLVAGGELQTPRGLTMDRDGHLIVADAGHHRIVVVDQQGQVVRAIGAPGHDRGQFHEPSGVAVDDAGNIYVADTWNARVVKLDPQGGFLAAWGVSDVPFGPAFNDPVTGQTLQRYAVDNGGDPAANERNPLGLFGPRNVLVHEGRVYIADTGNSRIVVTDLNGNVLQQFGHRGDAPGRMREPIGLAVDQHDRLYVGDTWNGRIQVFQITAQGVEPTPLAVLPVRGWAANTYDDPYIAAAPDGRVWAAVGRRNSIAEFGSDGRLLRRITTDPPLTVPKGLFWAGGALYVVNGGPDEVLRLPLP